MVSHALPRVARHPVVSHSNSPHAARTDQAVLRARRVGLRAVQAVRRVPADRRVDLAVPEVVLRRLPAACRWARLPVAVVPVVRVGLRAAPAVPASPRATPARNGPRSCRRSTGRRSANPTC